MDGQAPLRKDLDETSKNFTVSFSPEGPVAFFKGNCTGVEETIRLSRVYWNLALN